VEHTQIVGASISADTALRQDVKLIVGSSSQTVEVTSAAPLVDSTTSSMGEQLGTKQIENLPLNGRIFSQLVQTIPGSVPAGFWKRAGVRLGCGGPDLDLG